MTDGGESLDRLVELEGLQRGARAWRSMLAVAAALFGLAPFSTAIVPSLSPPLLHAGMALWSAFVLGWIVLVVHGMTLVRERRRLVATMADDDARR